MRGRYQGRKAREYRIFWRGDDELERTRVVSAHEMNYQPGGIEFVVHFPTEYTFIPYTDIAEVTW